MSVAIPNSQIIVIHRTMIIHRSILPGADWLQKVDEWAWFILKLKLQSVCLASDSFEVLITTPVQYFGTCGALGCWTRLKVHEEDTQPSRGSSVGHDERGTPKEPKAGLFMPLDAGLFLLYKKILCNLPGRKRYSRRRRALSGKLSWTFMWLWVGSYREYDNLTQTKTTSCLLNFVAFKSVFKLICSDPKGTRQVAHSVCAWIAY